jgi:hypothetical protein
MAPFLNSKNYQQFWGNFLVILKGGDLDLAISTRRDIERGLK